MDNSHLLQLRPDLLRQDAAIRGQLLDWLRWGFQGLSTGQDLLVLVGLVGVVAALVADGFLGKQNKINNKIGAVGNEGYLNTENGNITDM